MSLESVRRFFAEKAPDLRIIELETSTATSRCKPSTKCFRPPGRCTARSASPRNGWPSWWMRSGSMCARKSSRKPDGNCRAQARLSCQDTPKRSASQAKRWLKP